ncbi:MAG: hypothetical protein LIO54_03755 [Oscillospiraceae bacterium]|nr:hypothetical protein [Oscillospiraceae bacterium]
MYYCKIIRNGEIIDVCANYLRWQEKHDVMLSCEVADAQFAQSDGGAVYRLPWLNRLPVAWENSRYCADVETTEGTEITADEYAALQAQLDIGGTVAEETTETAAEPETESAAESAEAVMDAAAMRLKIQTLEAAVETLQAQLAALTEAT